MSLAKYEVLLKVVETGNLTRAAEVMGFTQSGISHAVQSLEREFGFSLLTRSRSGVKLTANGERVIKSIREIVNWNEQLKQEVAAVHGMEIGTVRIGTFTSVSVHWLPGIIKRYRGDYPAVEVKLYEGDYREIEDWIGDGQIDFGFLSLPTRDGFDAIPLSEDRMLCLVPKDHPLSGREAVTFAELAEEDFVMPKEGSDYDVKRVLRKAGVQPKIKYEAADDRAIIAMVENGLGVSVLPEMVLQAHQHHLALIPLEDGSCRTLGMAMQAVKDISPAARKFMEYARTWIDQWERSRAKT
ncbi:LysR family transcriptional regulator [Cohnella sp. REN36]|uniref:LysR family transcriptional regulator n=1 Tax=Cohnella sp. REN36 TaxID=2887347 RepID=UPI001D1470F0|nr:LysR family transcriptional regulator [Cohnella sp. REN36]MCC3375498.1 LysR family transcriptional regulator [Cohnella sp. REN36]